MKFGKEFIRVIEQTQPEFRDKFLCYKQLKKFLKQLPDTSVAEGATDGAPGSAGAQPEHKHELTQQERSFVRALNTELGKFNEFFMEKEEELVMLDRALGERAATLLADAAAPPALLASTCTALAKFHGELVLLEHWCSLNYAALVKILKKHDKRSRLSLRLPILVNVLRQPFYSTEVLSKLVRSAEERFQALASRLKAGGAGAEPAAQGDTAPVELPSLMQLPPPPSEDAPPAPEEEASMLARTRAALSCWQALSKSQSLGAPGHSGAGGTGGAARDADDSSEDERAPPVPPPGEPHAKKARVE